ncbi:MAG: hypothetical protein VZQ83_08890 [Eubacterium sp.]|nr:hypothetical protein [Eubacterium sp.]
MKNKSNQPSKATTIVPIILGILVIAAIIGVVLFFSMKTKEGPTRTAEEAADDGQLVDYEKDGPITLGDYHAVNKLLTKDDLSEENSDDPLGLLWDEYLKTCKIKKYPKELLDEALLDNQMQFQDFLEASGMSADELSASYNMDDDTIEENAKDNVKGRLVAKTIALREGMTMTDEKLREYLIRILEEDDKNISLDAILKEYIDGTGVRPRDDAYVEMVKDYLMEQMK